MRHALGTLLAATLVATTGAGPAIAQPETGPGGPILVLIDAADPFGFYYAEILRTEGLNHFAVDDVSSLSPALLADHDVVLLASVALSAGDVTVLSDWVTAGGRLIAMRPDPQLAGLLGLGVVTGTLSDGYLLVDDATTAGAGIVAETIQFHDTADLWTLAGAGEIAALYSDAATPAAAPAVTLNAVGMAGGLAAAFSYDLARSVAWTRQGNPAWAGLERDGQGAIRPWELFFSLGPSSGEPHWVDLDKIHIPQADEQQRLLANLILTGSDAPLPRFWYFPDDHAAVVVMTGDQHGCCGGTTGRLNTYLGFDPAGCSVDDWECVRSTSYIYPGGGMSDAEGVAWDALGFELGTHVETGCGNWTPASLDAAYTSQLGTFAAQFPSLPAPTTHRLHCIVWSDWATQPNVELSHGIRFDTNYYYLRSGNPIAADHPGMFTGSGMPMRFVELDGTMIDVYQATTQLTDESEQPYPFTIDSVLDLAIGPEGYYGAFTANMHQDNAASADAVAIVQSAQARGVPIVSSRQMLTWIDGRNDSAFQNLAWDGALLTFDVAADPGARNLRAMLPASAGSGQLTSVLRDGSPIGFTTRTVKGIEFGVFDAETGSYEASYAPDTTAPVISALTATPRSDGTADVTWDTDEPADSLVQYGTDPGVLDQMEASGARVTEHGLTLSGLAPNTTYHYRALSTDAAGNTATEPDPPAAPASFTTSSLVCIDDSTRDELSQGASLLATYAAATDDGELVLAPVAGAEFEDDGLPIGWETELFDGGTSATIAAGRITLDGARVNTEAFYGPGHTVEFRGTFQAAPNQHAGFAITTQEVGWAIFSTGGAGTSLLARSHDGSTFQNTDLGGAWLGSAHTYRIEWNAGSVDFYVDDALVESHTIAIALPLRPLAADSATSAGTWSVEWMRMRPYGTVGAARSRVIDMGTLATWDRVEWDAQEPVDTALDVSVRTGDTPVPDASWSAFVPIASSGDVLGGSSRYLQYQVDANTLDPDSTPVLEALRVTCELAPDTFPPAISGVDAASGPDGTTALVTWLTDEPSDSLVEYGTDPGALGSSASDATLVTAHAVPLSGLVPDTTYHYRVTSADALANAASEPDPGTLSFVTTVAPSICAADDVLADFQAGSPGADTHAAETDDGEVILAPIEAAEFDGSDIVAGRQVWEGSSGQGTYSVSGGQIQLDAGQVRTDAFYGPGQTFEAVATFGASTNHHVGFGVDLAFTIRWAILSTRNTTTNLFARTHDGTNAVDVDLGTGYIGTPHHYRIDWNAASVDFYIDGALVHSEPVTIADTMRPLASDSLGGLPFDVDWIRMTPYPAAGSFESRVFDAGVRADWSDMSWSADEPAGTSFAMNVRTGDTAVPDGSWTAYTFVPASGQDVDQVGRYAQYRADLSAGPSNRVTPALEDVELLCTPAPACSDGEDNDGDLDVDHPADAGCRSETDPSEEFDCADGLDNDGDTATDHPADPGCFDADGELEDPACDDGIDNDDDGLIDWDGGDGDPGSGAEPDPQCVDRPFRNRETPRQGCGLGGELALALAGAAALARRRRPTRERG